MKPAAWIVRTDDGAMATLDEPTPCAGVEVTPLYTNHPDTVRLNWLERNVGGFLRLAALERGLSWGAEDKRQGWCAHATLREAIDAEIADCERQSSLQTDHAGLTGDDGGKAA